MRGCSVRSGCSRQAARRSKTSMPGLLDLALEGMTATIEALEQDFEGRIYLAVILDDDPGNDFGALRQPGHRFFFKPEEVEPLSSMEAAS